MNRKYAAVLLLLVVLAGCPAPNVTGLWRISMPGATPSSGLMMISESGDADFDVYDGQWWFDSGNVVVSTQSNEWKWTFTFTTVNSTAMRGTAELYRWLNDQWKYEGNASAFADVVTL